MIAARPLRQAWPRIPTPPGSDSSIDGTTLATNAAAGPLAAARASCFVLASSRNTVPIRKPPASTAISQARSNTSCGVFARRIASLAAPSAAYMRPS